MQPDPSDPIAYSVRWFRMHVLAHRLRKYGFEPQINKLSTDDLDMLKDFLYPHQKEALEREIAERKALTLQCHA